MTKPQKVETLQGEKVTTGKALKPLDVFRNTLDGNRKEFLKILPQHIPYEKFQRTVMTAIFQNADLLQADRTSLIGACLKSATDGLLPDGRDAALVIFNSNKKIDGEFKTVKMVQYLPMYAGILKKVRQSGDLSSVETHIVYEKDKFTYILGDGAKIEHVPYLGAEDRGDILAAYCIAKLKDGTFVREVMTRGDIEKVRKASKAGSMNDYDARDQKKNPGAKVGDPKGIWAAWYEEMARKTVFRRCAKWLPQNIELSGAVFENDHSMEVMTQIEGGTPEATPDDGATTIEGTATHIVDEETGEIIPREDVPEKQPDLKAEVAAKKEKKPAKADEKPSADEDGFPGDKPFQKPAEGKLV